MSACSPPADSFGRRVEYLRISVTERCDLRCAYCHPPAAGEPPQPDSLAPDDVVGIARAACRLGVRRIRLTGGEPLLRPDLEGIVARLGELPGLEDLALTTNGQHLAERAAGLARAGLRRVNISLDSLDPEVYRALTGGGDLSAARRGLEAALAAGLSPVKINVVLASPAALGRAGIPAFAALIQEVAIHVRFIEAMPTCSHVGYLPADRVLALLSQDYQLEPVAGPPGGGPARYYRLDGSAGTVGIIAPISEPFCAHCNRLRVSARGELRPCLFSAQGFDLLPALRGADPSADLRALLLQAVASKPRCYGDIAGPAGVPAMHVIGG